MTAGGRGHGDGVIWFQKSWEVIPSREIEKKQKYHLLDEYLMKMQVFEN